MKFLVVALLLLGASAQAKGREGFSHLPPGIHGKLLSVPHHAQSTPVWCWAASIAMVAEYLKKTPITDCDVATKLDKANFGDGHCCTSDNRPDTQRCFRGQRSPVLTEVMNTYFNLTATEIHRPLTWDEVTTTIDAGFPAVAELYFGNGLAHAIVIMGYAAPDYVLIDDPAVRHPKGTMGAHLGQLGAPHGSWVMTWYMRRDENAGYLGDNKVDAPPPPPPAQLRQGPAQSTVSATLPSLTDGAMLKRIRQRLTHDLDSVRGCYDDALTGAHPPPSPTTVRLKFAVDQGTPTWITVKDAGGLTPTTVRCVTDAVARWTGLFPTSGDFDETQKLEITFAKLAEKGH